MLHNSIFPRISLINLRSIRMNIELKQLTRADIKANA
jgi:hypothetical protein